MPLTSDPHAYLRPFYARLRQHPAFSQFAPAHQFEQLVQAVQSEHPSKAEELREWSAAAQHALLLHLASRHELNSPADPVALWTVLKNDRQLRCIAVYLPSGIDVRLMEGDDFRRTQLCRDAPAVETLSDAWCSALIARGWTKL